MEIARLGSSRGRIPAAGLTQSQESAEGSQRLSASCEKNCVKDCFLRHLFAFFFVCFSPIAARGINVSAMACFSRSSSFFPDGRGGLRNHWSWAGLLLVVLQIGQPAVAQTETRVWSGTGQILSGQGQGATVQLILETGGGRIWSQSGPALDAPFSGGHISVTSGDGTWQIQSQGDQLLVTFYRGEQIIRWQLRPMGEIPSSSPSAPSSSLSSDPAQPVALPVQELVIPVLKNLPGTP
jgi:hypothetical protein